MTVDRKSSETFFLDIPEYVVTMKSCSGRVRMRGQDLIEPGGGARNALLWQAHTHHSCLPPQIQCDNTATQFLTPETFILKPISADDLVLFRDEVNWGEAGGNQINFSLVLMEYFEERTAEGSHWMQPCVFFLIMSSSRWTHLKHGEISFCLD